MSKIGLLFPGQGCQYIGMGQKLYDSISSSRNIMDLSNDILGFNIRNIIFEGNEADLKLTEIAQPAIYIVSAMYLEKFKELNADFEVVAGHSLGEYSALYSAGVFSFEEGLRLVRKRGLAMGRQNSLGTMFAIMGVSLDEIDKYLEVTNGKTVVANINSKGQIVISGYTEETTKVAEQLSLVDGSKIKQLNVSGAFHSPLMQESKEIMNVVIDKIYFNEPTSFVISNVSAKMTKDVKIIKENLKNQITGKVNWLDTIMCMKNNEIEKLYEVGPGEVLKKLNKSIVLRPKCESI